MTEPRHAILGAGPVGQALVSELVSRGHRPLLVTRSGAQIEGSDTVALDVRDTTALTGLLSRESVGVVHQSAQPAYHRWAQEFPALQASIIEACGRSGSRLVVVENLYGYGRTDKPLTEADPLTATTRKGAVRARMWHDLDAAHRAGRVEALAVRASDFVGPGVGASTFGDRFFGRLVAGKPAEVFGPLHVRHSVTYVPDLARSMVELSAHDRAFGRPWHVPNAPSVTVGALVDLAADAAGVPPRSRRIRAWQLRLAGIALPAAREMVEMLDDHAHDVVVDDWAIRREFGLDHTPLDVAVERTVADYRGATPEAAR